MNGLFPMSALITFSYLSDVFNLSHKISFFASSNLISLVQQTFLGTRIPTNLGLIIEILGVSSLYKIILIFYFSISECRINSENWYLMFTALPDNVMVSM